MEDLEDAEVNKKLNARYASDFLTLTEENCDLQFRPKFLFPGDECPVMKLLPTKKKNRQLTIGWGLSCESSDGGISSATIRSVSAGVYQYRSTSKGCYYFVENSSRRKYFPSVIINTSSGESASEVTGTRGGDNVVGIIEDKGGDYYVVNIFSGTHCILSRLAFEGATKRNKPELKRGDVVYARIISTSTESGEIEISCQSTGALKKDWSTGETVRF